MQLLFFSILISIIGLSLSKDNWQVSSKNRTLESRILRNCNCGISKYGVASCDGIGERSLSSQSRIASGKIAEQGEYPWQVKINLNKPNGKFCSNCGGTIINHRYILTAVHCVYCRKKIGSPKQFLIDVGLHHMYKKEATINHKEIEVEDVITHPDYDYYNLLTNDIAILKLKEDLVFNEDVAPACLPKQDESFIGQTGVVTGWGALYHGHYGALVLHKVGQRVLPQDDPKCLKGALRNPGVPVPPQEMCAYRERGDSCNGDSGGPFVTDSNGRCTLIGIVSRGYKCDHPGYPGIYARVAIFKDWIVKNTKDGGCLDE